jgi:glycosyltransferase involved in cell wall biosynthesis
MATREPRADLLRAQIESIRAQTHGRWVCLISDDASSATAKREIERAIGGDDRFLLETGAEAVGFYRNFERALAMVPPEASYVALSDQDDRWHADKLAALIAALGPGDVLAHSDARVVDASGAVIAETFWPRGRPRDDRLADALYANPVTGASALFRREVLDPALPFPDLAGPAFHDRWIALVCIVLGGVAYVDRPLYDYVQHPEAAHGHARAVGVPGREPAGASARTDGEAYLARSVTEATALRERLADRLSAGDRRALERIESLPSSATAQLRVGARWLTRAPRSRPGIEGALVRGILRRRASQRRWKTTRS